jgi:HNH endonuclease.
MTTKPPRSNLLKSDPKVYRAKALRIAFRRLGHNFSVDEILVLMNNDICPYCNKQIEPLLFSIDHRLPKNRGGSNELSNLQLIDIKCNKVKGDLTDEEFKRLMAFLKDNLVIYENLYRRLRMAGMVFMFNKKRKSK